MRKLVISMFFIAIFTLPCSISAHEGEDHDHDEAAGDTSTSKLESGIGWQALLRQIFVIEQAQGNNADQHKHRGSEGIQEELHCGINAALATPNPNQEIHWNQGEFPEDVEQEQVLSEEHAQHPSFLQQN